MATTSASPQREHELFDADRGGGGEAFRQITFVTPQFLPRFGLPPELVA
jgi:hypothetical protein